MKDKISIIIPVYNVENYIRRCLDSVINQTYTNLEILLINDGSTDSSGEICDEYAKLDSRIRVFHKENGGSSSARNVGLKNFTGAYVGFVDSDDWLELDMYEILYKLIKRKNVSIGVCGFSSDTNTEYVPRKNIKSIPQEILSSKDMLMYIFKLDCYNAFHIVVWNKLYSADIFANNNIYFDEKLKFGEDNLFMPSVFLTENCTGAFVEKSLYHYYQRETSIMKSTSLETRIKCILYALKSVIDLFEQKGHKDLTQLVKKEYCYNASLLAECAIEVDNKNILLDMQKEMQLYFNEYVKETQEYPDRIERIQKLLES